MFLHQGFFSVKWKVLSGKLRGRLCRLYIYRAPRAHINFPLSIFHLKFLFRRCIALQNADNEITLGINVGAG